jgi:hypothetical protein
MPRAKPPGLSRLWGLAVQIIPTRDGLITLKQAAQLTGRSVKTCWGWTDPAQGYVAADGTRVVIEVKRRAGRTLLVDPVDVAKAAHATDPRGLYRAARPLTAA